MGACFSWHCGSLLSPVALAPAMNSGASIHTPADGAVTVLMFWSKASGRGWLLYSGGTTVPSTKKMTAAMTTHASGERGQR